MKLTLTRFSDNGWATYGDLVAGDFKCFTLEDTYREDKIFGMTCIPEGEYQIKLRTEGRHHLKYTKEFIFHKGMLWLQDVPNFKYILIHIGNKVEDTNGCILVGTTILEDGFLQESTRAYVQLYPRVIEAFDKGEPVTIEIKYKDETIKNVK